MPSARVRSDAPQLLDSPENSPRQAYRRPLGGDGGVTATPLSAQQPQGGSLRGFSPESEGAPFEEADVGEDVHENDDPLKRDEYGSFVAPGIRDRAALPLRGSRPRSSNVFIGDRARGDLSDSKAAQGRTRSFSTTANALDSFDDCRMDNDRPLSETWCVAKRFGFPCSMNGAVTEAELHAQPMLLLHAQQCEEKWTVALRSVQISINASPESCEAMRKMMRKVGIPCHMRPVIWLITTGVALKMDENPSFCSALLSRHGFMTGEPAQTITKDLERTFPEHPYFDPEENGIVLLKRVLHALCWRNPLLNYCQSFNFLAAVILLVIDNEEAAFWLMVHLLENVLPNDYYGEGLVGLKVDQEVTLHLLWDTLPKLAQHFQCCNFDVRTLVPQWIMCLYVNIFPIETVVRVWDYILAQDCGAGTPTAPVTILLAALRLHHDELLQLTDSSEIMVCINRWSEMLFDANRLIKTAHEMKVPPSQLFALRRHYKVEILAEHLKLAELRKARHSERAAAAAAAAAQSLSTEPLAKESDSTMGSSGTGGRADAISPLSSSSCMTSPIGVGGSSNTGSAADPGAYTSPSSPAPANFNAAAATTTSSSPAPRKVHCDPATASARGVSRFSVGGATPSGRSSQPPQVMNQAEPAEEMRDFTVC